MRRNILFKISLFILPLLIGGAGQCQTNESRPNILFVIADDQSHWHTSFAGAEWVSTPGFDRVAREGIYFRNCYAGSPGCAPSRSSIITGRYHWQNEEAGQHAAGWYRKYVPFVDLLTANGYHTGMTGKGVAPFKYGDPPLRKEDAAGKSYNEKQYKAGSSGDERFASGINSTDYFANFKLFLEDNKEKKPFFFWYGSKEPHRAYEKDSWKRMHKKPETVKVPGFLPDNDVIRGDLLDYAVEIEWFDLHLQRMIAYLEETGELENTIIIVTADNGMPFPRAKANAYEYGIHVPLAIRYPKKFPGGRTVSKPVSFIDLAPTILEITNTSPAGMLPITGESFLPILESDEKQSEKLRDYAITGRERHSSSRYKNWGYPQRSIRKGNYLLVWNMKPDRWPAGAPQRLVPGSPGGRELYPYLGIDENGVHHSEWAFTDIDASPSKSFVVEHHDDGANKEYFELAVDKRPEYELYDVEKDPDCLSNLATGPEFTSVIEGMKAILLQVLKTTEDPRVVGPDTEIFDSYPRYSPMREFPKPE